jgi:hypothetical protein
MASKNQACYIREDPIEDHFPKLRNSCGVVSVCVADDATTARVQAYINVFETSEWAVMKVGELLGMHRYFREWVTLVCNRRLVSAHKAHFDDTRNQQSQDHRDDCSNNEGN